MIDQVRALAAFGCAVDGRPQLQQVVQVPLQFRRGAANASGARDDAHAIGVFELVQRFFQVSPVFAFNATAHTAAARVIGHQHDIAARQRHKRRQRRALVAALFFFDLNQQLLAFTNRVLNARLADRHALRKVLFGDLFERQKTVAVFAIVDKAGFERWLNPRDDSFVNIALALLAPFNFNLVVEQLLPVNNRQAAFFCLRGVNQHPFHGCVSFFSSTCPHRKDGAIWLYELKMSELTR